MDTCTSCRGRSLRPVDASFNDSRARYTIVIAIGGFKSFGRWRREQLEGKRIDIAIEALTMAYRTKFVFQNIRALMAMSNEWEDMPKLEDDTDNKRMQRGSFYAVFKRIQRNKDY